MEALVNFLNVFYVVYLLCIFAWALISWLPMVSPQLAYNETVVATRRFLDSVVEPYVRLFRFIPPVRIGAMMLDLSALVAILAYTYLGRIVLNIIEDALVG